MPFVYGFLRRARRRPGGGRPVDPDYGIEEGELPEISPPDPDDPEVGGGPVVPTPPPGLWPPLTPEHPWRPIPPGRPGHPLPRPPRPPGVGGGPAPQPPAPGQPLPGEPPEVGGGPVLPPGTVWPPLPPGVTGHYWALVAIGGMPGGTVYRYVIIDADARPEHPIAPGGTPQPK